jgi:gliding motility-associated-like protein
MSILNDTSISIQFKNINWLEKIHASLPAGRCMLNVSDSLLLNVSSIPDAINLGPDTILCTGNSLKLHAGPGYFSYQWQDGSTDSTLTLTQTGEYFVVATDHCGNSYHDTIIVSPAQFYFSLGPDTAKCNSDTLVLKATTGFNNYQWFPNNYRVQNDQVSGIAYVYPAVDTNYIVTAEKWPGCFVKDTIHISVFHSPVINLGNDTSLCYGQSALLQAGSGFTSYLWNTGESSAQIYISNPGLYSVKATSANGCISADTMKLINVYPLPAFSLCSSADTTVCENKKLSYSYSFPNATYQWSDGNATGRELIQSPGTYWLAVTQNGCVSRDTMNVIFQQAPNVQLGNDTTLCEGITKLLDATTQNASYLWQDGTASSTFNVNTAGNYFVSVMLNGCVSSDTIQINYLAKPQFAFDSTKFICQGAELKLEPAINTPVSYAWQDGSSNPYYIVTEPGIYSLSVSNSCGVSESSIQVVTGQCKLWMPNAFSPNFDGINDVFRVKYVYPVNEFRMQIFSRWGQLIFNSKNMSDGWNGTLNGEPMPQGTYVWMINLTDNNNVKQSYSGTVILIR